MARRLGVRVPELALIDVDPEIGRREPDEEVQELVAASAGLNLAMDFLPGSIGYDRSFDVPVADASGVVWLDAYVANVDRSRRNTNLLIWHRSLWAIDHGACLAVPPLVGRSTALRPSPPTTTPITCSAGSAASAGRARRSERESHPAEEPSASVLTHVPDAWLAPECDPPDPRPPPDAATARSATWSSC